LAARLQHALAGGSAAGDVMRSVGNTAEVTPAAPNSLALPQLDAPVLSTEFP